MASSSSPCSGNHYNFELGKDLTQTLFEVSDYGDMVTFKNDLYLKLAQNFPITAGSLPTSMG